MTNEVALRTTFTLPSESEFQMLQVVAKNAAASGLYTAVGSEQKIFMIFLAARELGIPFIMALNGGLWNIKGRIEISARLMSGMIRRTGHSIIVIHSDAEKCVLEGVRKDNGDTFRASFTKEDATKAGLWGSGAWKSYPEDMLYNRAMSRLARRLFADVIGTAYVEGEISDAEPFKKDKNTIEAEVIQPDNQESVKESPKENIEPAADLSEEEIKAYLESWIPFQAEFLSWMSSVIEKNKWTYRVAVETFSKNLEYTKKTFEEWKVKNVENKTP